MPVPPLSGKVPGLPQSICAAVEKGLAKTASERFATCSEFAAAVVSRLAALEPEPDTVRLLCPSCKNILKLPQKAAGKTGRCPRCQAAMDVAADLGSLWLESEERGVGAPGRVTGRPDEPKAPESEKTFRRGTNRLLQVTALVVAGIGLMLSSLLWGSGNRNAITRQHAREINSLQTKLDTLQSENRQLSEALAAARMAGSGDAPIGETAEWLTDQVTNSIGMALIRIPKGEFIMGSPITEKNRSGDESQTRVTLSRDFLLGQTEVTRGQWEQVMGTKPWGGSSDKSADDLPAVNVSWDDVTTFCRKLTDRERANGKLQATEVYRLPTEAEWEYACRAGTTTAYSFGDDESLLRDFAWFVGNSGGVAQPVGTKQSNPWGLHDMHGNVWEWCSDGYVRQRMGGIDPVSSEDLTNHVARGGSWSFNPPYCRSAYRHDPSLPRDTLGFRVARSESVK